jgi:hypothetical protein
MRKFPSLHLDAVSHPILTNAFGPLRALYLGDMNKIATHFVYNDYLSHYNRMV